MIHVTPYLELGVGYAPYLRPSHKQEWYDWKGANPLCKAGAGLEIRWDPKQTGYLDLGWQHTSNCAVGFPFNDQRETALDSIDLKYRWRF